MPKAAAVVLGAAAATDGVVVRSGAEQATGVQTCVAASHGGLTTRNVSEAINRTSG
jgi:hypothetical protein